MKYKISDTPLKLREFGRNVQMMVEHARTIEDDARRNALIHQIIRYMANINPKVQDQPEYEQKLWDALYHLADYNIRVESDFPMQAPEEFLSRPVERMTYSNKKPRFRQYGSNIEFMVKKAMEMEEGDRKHALINLIANIMKMHIKGNDSDSHVERAVIEHFKGISNGVIAPGLDDIKWYKGPPKGHQQTKAPTPTSNKKRKKRKHRY